MNPDQHSPKMWTPQAIDVFPTGVVAATSRFRFVKLGKFAFRLLR
jgi:hypothetical protein